MRLADFLEIFLVYTIFVQASGVCNGIGAGICSQRIKLSSRLFVYVGGLLPRGGLSLPFFETEYLVIKHETLL